MDVRVDEVLRGRLQSKTIRIWGDDGALCRPYVSRFARNTEWIFAIYRNERESKQDYQISVCGEFWLRVEKDLVSGAVSDSTEYGQSESVTLTELRSALKEARDRRMAAIPTDAPSIVGTVTWRSDRGLQVEVNPDEATGSPKAKVHVPKGTPMVDREGRMYDPWRIPLGSRVSVWFTGPVAESYPVQATALCVVLEEPNR
jgi:hypothetical protein